jgi:HD-GYP domain-containing protein (c-di-GMP phosphodiesterase class II)/DNA-binding CsgD family transcriptional regulator
VSSTDGLRLSELLAALALATDLGTGQSSDHSLRTCLLSVAIAREMGCDDATIAVVHQVALLRFLGCTADASETAAMTGGQDAAFLAAMAPAYMGSAAESVRGLAGALAADQPALRRARLLGRALADAGHARRSLSAHCEVGARLARRLGTGAAVVESLAHAYERWDGKGFPDGLAGEAVPLAIRVVAVARDLDLWTRAGGPEVAAEVLRRRRGHGYDPRVVDAATAAPPIDDSRDVWADVLAAEPFAARVVRGGELDTALTAFADFADLKSLWTRGHSGRVAELAEEAGRRCGLPDADLVQLRRAGLVHDLGRVGVAAGVWDTPGPLGVARREKVRLHPYLTERVLSRCHALRPLAALAGAHHERIDGSGYHRGIDGGQLPIPARLLAAADVLAAMTADRPHRTALSLDAARDHMRADPGLDPSAVEAVLAAAGAASAGLRSRRWPAGLSDREVEVLRLIARGRSNREVAQLLVVSPKTVGRHVENLYAKIGIRSRAAAAVFAMEHRLLS